jgi:hypothetical protein
LPWYSATRTKNSRAPALRLGSLRMASGIKARSSGVLGWTGPRDVPCTIRSHPFRAREKAPKSLQDRPPRAADAFPAERTRRRERSAPVAIACLVSSTTRAAS